jgi:hypothetical protein
MTTTLVSSLLSCALELTARDVIVKAQGYKTIMIFDDGQVITTTYKKTTEEFDEFLSLAVTRRYDIIAQLRASNWVPSSECEQSGQTMQVLTRYKKIPAKV